ncbi:MAG: hypothetical protein IKX40_03945 [Thermoguttaceae bacterium]|nr:hypothetical protein [Thermoguttaceae bacterium]
MEQAIVQTGLFPGRFQPFTNAHLERIKSICSAYPDITLCVLIGDVGELNKSNFLTVSEREFMINEVLQNNDLTNRVVVRHLKGAEPETWVSNVLKTVQNLKIVFSDNPFVYQPFIKAGIHCVIHRRAGVNSCDLRTYPFETWKDYVPKEVFEFIANNKLYKRIQELESSEKYPFLTRENSES